MQNIVINPEQSLPICLRLELVRVGKWRVTLDPDVMHVRCGHRSLEVRAQPCVCLEPRWFKGSISDIPRSGCREKDTVSESIPWGVCGDFFHVVCHCHCCFYIRLHSRNLLVPASSVFAWMDTFAKLLSFVSVVCRYERETRMPTTDLYA